MVDYTTEIDELFYTINLDEGGFALLARLVQEQPQQLIEACLDQAGEEAPGFSLKVGGKFCSCGVARAMIVAEIRPHKKRCPEAVYQV